MRPQAGIPYRITRGFKRKFALVTTVFWVLAAFAPASTGQNRELADAALDRTRQSVRYDPAYVAIPYPGGDVPGDTGVCTDLVIRSLRETGIDLQQRVHEDMLGHFERYPSRRLWGLTRPDPNIDHRRVPNLQVYFARRGQSLAPSGDPADYLPGDIVTWMLPGNLPHIGIVTDREGASGRRLVAHNIGNGPELEDMLFDYPVTGHYRYPAPVDSP